MILKKIKIENIRSYGTAEIDIPEGIVLFEGDIGSGKSTILMCIEFVLFGLPAGGGKALLAKKKDSGSVTLNFEAGGVEYQIARGLTSKNDAVQQDSSRSYIIANRSKQVLSPTDLKKRVMDILKFNEPVSARAESKIFRYAVFTPQEEMKSVLADADKRLATIRKAFRIEDYIQAVENAESLVKEIKARMSALAERFADLAELREAKLTCEKEAESLAGIIDATKARLREEESANRAIKDELASLQAKSRSAVELESRIASIAKQIEIYQKEIARARSDAARSNEIIKKIDAEIERLNRMAKPTEIPLGVIKAEIERKSRLEARENETRLDAGRLKSRIVELEGNLGSSADADVEMLRGEISKAEAMSANTEAERAKLQRQQNEWSEKRGELSAKANLAASELEKIAKLGTKCHVCKNEITQEHKAKLESEMRSIADGAQKEIDQLNEDNARTAGALKECEDRLKSYRSEMEEKRRIIPMITELNKDRQNMEQLKQDADSISAEMEQYPEGLSGSAAYLAELREKLVEYQNAQSQALVKQENRQAQSEQLLKIGAKIESAEKEIRQLEQDKSEAQSGLAEFAGIAASIKECQGRLDESGRRSSELNQTLGRQNEDLENKKEKASEYGARITEAASWKKEHGRLDDYCLWISKYFVPSVRTIERQVMVQTQEQFNKRYRMWYDMMIDDPTKETIIDENFTPSVRQDGFVQDVSYLSGGEKTGIALAYRLALNSLMRDETDSLKSNLLILDEPTDGFSDSQLAKMKDILDKLESKQIILVSHEKELETFAGTVFKVTKESGESRISAES